MTNGLSLHTGINRVDPGSYGGWTGPLRGCEFDAADLREVCAVNRVHDADVVDIRRDRGRGAGRYRRGRRRGG